jgi:DNA-binding protein HU-beta
MSIEKQELVRRISERVEVETGIVDAVIDATIEEIYESLQKGDSVSLRNFGTFYVRVESRIWVFKFNPSQRL